MNGKMEALKALLEMLSQMDLKNMQPPKGGEMEVKLEMENPEGGPETEADGGQAEKIIEKMGTDSPGDLGQAMDAAKPGEAGDEDLEELKKLYGGME